MDGSYTYPDHPTDKDRQGVLRNKFGLTRHSQLRPIEYRATDKRLRELNESLGPKGKLDAAHLKAIHGHIFQDVYEWAGHTRNETPMVDGMRVDPVGHFSKGGSAFLHGSKIDLGLHEALRPLAGKDALRNLTTEQFAEKAGRVLGELNYVHPFREGNGRAQEAFIKEAGRHAGYEVDMSGITRERMIAASIAHSNDPDSRAMVDLIKDSIDPARRAALRDANRAIGGVGKDPHDYDTKTAQPGQTTSGRIFFATADAVTVSDGKSLVVHSRTDFPAELAKNGEAVQVQSRGEFGRPPGPEKRHELQQVEAERRETPAPEQIRTKGSGEDYER
ncbi:Fic family protein [Devosia sp.]|uniref:Fic/DOC family protein n=1 Tax=Devosia sp. TaxID=1871048 RepID=UPI0025C4CB9B|nr:Fic family protein [Devosia sp.]